MPNPVYDYRNWVKDVLASQANEELKKAQKEDKSKVYRLGQPYNDSNNYIGIFADPKPESKPVLPAPARKSEVKKTDKTKSRSKK